MELIDRILRPHLKNFIPYSTARDEYKGKKGTFLDANENPHGSAAGGKWNRYPDPSQQSLKRAITGIKAIDPEHTFIGNGSDEPIDLLIRAFCEPGQDNIMIFPPTYGMYEVSAGVNNVAIREVSLKDDFHLDVEGAIEAMDEHTKIIFVCSPNNPTGNKMQTNDIESLLKNASGLVVVDEAYIDFTPQQSFAHYLGSFENLVVLHTLSKAWGMAAFRLGMAFAHEEIINVLNKIKAPYNISGPVQHSTLTSLMNFQKKNGWVEEIVAERDRVRDAISRLSNVIKVYHSDANFLLVKFSNAAEVFSYLHDSQVIVRDKSKSRLCEGCLRITIGTPSENERLLLLLKSLE